MKPAPSAQMAGYWAATIFYLVQSRNLNQDFQDFSHGGQEQCEQDNVDPPQPRRGQGRWVKGNSGL